MKESPVYKFRKYVSGLISPEKQVNKYAHWEQGQGTGYYQTAVAHKLQELISGKLNYDSTDPREQMRLAKILIENIPPLKRAVQLQSDFLGSVRFGSDDPKLKDILNKWADTLPVKNPLNTDYSFFKGMTELTRQSMRVALTSGMSFMEELYGERDLMEGVTLFDSNNFTYQQDGNKQRLVYDQPMGGRYFIEKSDHFHVFANTFQPGSLWGQTMVSGGEFFAEILIQMLVAVKNNYIRYGSPIGMNVFSLDAKGETMAPQDVEVFKTAVTDIQANWMKALRGAELGERGEIVASLPGDVKLHHSTYGAGVNASQGQMDDVGAILRHVAGLTGIPVELLSFDTGGEGFSGEKWRVLYSILNVKMETARHTMELIVRQIARNYLISIKANPRFLDAFWVEFESLDFANDKSQAETELVRAQAIEMNIKNALAVFQELTSGDPDAMRRFLDAVGLDYVESSTPSPIDPMAL